MTSRTVFLAQKDDEQNARRDSRAKLFNLVQIIVDAICWTFLQRLSKVFALDACSPDARREQAASNRIPSKFRVDSSEIRTRPSGSTTFTRRTQVVGIWGT